MNLGAGFGVSSSSGIVLSSDVLVAFVFACAFSEQIPFFWTRSLKFSSSLDA